MTKWLAIIAVLLVLSGCSGEGAHAVRDGRVRDTIYATETKANGSNFIWMTHDDVGVYCTMDKALYDKANAIFNDGTKVPLVWVDYISANRGSAERPAFLSDPLSLSGCSHTEATVYVFTGIERIETVTGEVESND